MENIAWYSFVWPVWEKYWEWPGDARNQIITIFKE